MAESSFAMKLEKYVMLKVPTRQVIRANTACRFVKIVPHPMINFFY